MSWAALIVAGTVLAQIQPNSSGLQKTSPDYPESAPIGAGAYGAADTTQMPGGYGRMQGPDARSVQAPFSDRQAGDPWAAVPPAGPPAGQQSGQVPWGTGGAPATDPSTAPTTGSNVLDTLFMSQEQRDKKAAAQGQAAPSFQPPYPAQQPAVPGSEAYGLGGNYPAVPNRSTAQLPTVPKLTVEETLQQAMTLPPSTVVAGRNVTLLDVLGQVTDRSKRVAIAHAYWQLAARLGEYRFCWEEARLIESIESGTIEADLLRSVQQIADRELTAAELALLQAQYDLAEAAGLDSSGQLPLPGDRPHIRSYNTNFDRIFSGRTPPGQTRLLHRILPLQQRVIDARWEAVQAAQDAYQAVARSYQAGQVDATDLLAALHETTAQRRAWIAAIAQYNHGIADYGLTIAGPETTGRDLVSILIKLSQVEPTDNRVSPIDSGQPGVPTLAPPRNRLAETGVTQGLPPVPIDPVDETDLAVEPTSAEEPATVDGSTVKPAVAEMPSPESAAEVNTAASGHDNPQEKTIQDELPPEKPLASAEKPDEVVLPAEEEDPGLPALVASEGNPSEPAAEGVPMAPEATEPAETSPPARDLAVQTQPMVPVDETDSTPRVQTVFRQPDSSTSVALIRQHDDLVGLRAEIQAKRLTASFLGGSAVGRPEAEVVDLEACLEGVAGGRRRAIIEAYWEASQSLAEYDVHRKHVELLASLVRPVTLGSAGTEEARARLKASRLDAEADLLEAETRLIAAQYELTGRCERSLEGPWLIPKTLPHAGDYRLNLAAQPAQIVESWPVRRLATIIPALYRSLNERAAAVVEADATRVEVVNTYWTQSLPFDRVLAAVDSQTRESLEFLKVLGAYNQSYADYVTAVVPEALPVEQLVAALVIR